MLEKEIVDFSRHVHGLEELIGCVETVNRHNVCCGYPWYDMFENLEFKNAVKDGNVMRNNKCPILIPRGEICVHCHGLERYLFRVFDNAKKPKKRLRSLSVSSSGSSSPHVKRNRTMRQKLSRKDLKIKRLKDDLVKCHQQIEEIKNEDLEKKINQFSLPDNQVIKNYN